jgi:ribosome-binding protein aMBF1 (putative translation factor)
MNEPQLCHESFTRRNTTVEERAAGSYSCSRCGRNFRLGAAQREATDRRSQGVMVPQHRPARAPSTRPVAPSGPHPQASPPATVAEQIRAALDAQGIGVTELARRLGKDHGHVSRALAGQMGLTPAMVQSCADALQIELVVPEVRYRPEGRA